MQQCNKMAKKGLNYMQFKIKKNMLKIKFFKNAAIPASWLDHGLGRTEEED